jgi:predicted nucleic acid-binding Zn ribbon protein
MTARDRCIRCGGPVAEGAAVCNRCNPAHLPSPSSTQYHATVFLVVLATLVLTAAWLILRG